MRINPGQISRNPVAAVFILAVLFLAGTFIAPSVRAEMLSLIKAFGKVDLQEIGGSGLYVFSIWDTGASSPVRPDGGFVTVISSARPQKIALKDRQKMTRALAIVLPRSASNIRFDARSTAFAILCCDNFSFRTSADVRRLSEKAENNRSFQDLIDYLRKNLVSHPVEELLVDPECVAILKQCSKDILKEDTEEIQRSLSAAERKLRKVLAE